MLIDPDFLEHWRTRMLIDTLNDPCAPFCIMRLWAHCQVRKGDRFSLSSVALKALCRFEGDADELERAMTECGWIERDGEYIVAVGWAEKNIKLINAWDNGRQGGRPRKPKKKIEKTHTEPTGNPRVTHAKPTDNPRVTHTEPTGNPEQTHGKPIGLDRIGEDLTGSDSSPPPPKPAAAAALALTPDQMLQNAAAAAAGVLRVGEWEKIGKAAGLERDLAAQCATVLIGQGVVEAEPGTVALERLSERVSGGAIKNPTGLLIKLLGQSGGSEAGKRTITRRRQSDRRRDELRTAIDSWPPGQHDAVRSWVWRLLAECIGDDATGVLMPDGEYRDPLVDWDEMLDFIAANWGEMCKRYDRARA